MPVDLLIAGDYAERAALVLFLWAVLGWLLPTLLLLAIDKDADRQQEQQQPQQREEQGTTRHLMKNCLAWVGSLCESVLNTLLPPKRIRFDDNGEAQAEQAYALFTFCLYWVGVLLFLWWGACALAGPVKPAEHPGFWYSMQGLAGPGNSTM